MKVLSLILTATLLASLGCSTAETEQRIEYNGYSDYTPQGPTRESPCHLPYLEKPIEKGVDYYRFGDVPRPEDFGMEEMRNS